MRRIGLLLLLAVIALPVNLLNASEQTEEHDFRRARWGMTRAEAVDSEQGDVKMVKAEKAHVIYTVEILDFPAALLYEFDAADKLFSGLICLRPDEEKKTSGIYETISKQLTQKYGQPSKNGNLSEEENDLVARMFGQTMQTYKTKRTWITLSNIQGSVCVKYLEVGEAKKQDEELKAKVKKDSEKYDKKRSKDLSSF